jgi:hypothetical protein
VDEPVLEPCARNKLLLKRLRIVLGKGVGKGAQRFECCSRVTIPLRESGRGQVQCEVMDLRNALIAVVYPFKKQCNTQAEYDAVLAGSHTQTVC